ncbi:MAG: M3 family oligoendopeptidase [bacterium]
MTKQSPDQAHWDLDQILKIADFDKVFAEVEAQIPEYTSWLKKFTPDMPTQVLQDYFTWHFEVNEKLTRLYDRGALWESTDAKSGEPAQLKSRAQDLSIELSEVARPIGMWLKGKAVDGLKTLDDQNAARLFAGVEGMEYPLQYSRSMARHTLSLSEEDIITHKDATGVGVLIDLREALETDFRYSLKLDGKTEKYETASELLKNIYSPEPARREAAYQALYKPFEDNKEKLFKIYQAVVKDWAYEAKLRGYASSIGMRNAGNHIPDEAIETLLEVCEQESVIYQDFFHWKKSELGLDKLQRSDIYAPIGESKQEFTYPEAVDLVMTSFKAFSPDFAAKAQRILDENHVDSHPSPTKRGGAFCATIMPSMAPYVLLNYANRGRDISTLAHELGHGVHSLYADHLPIASQHANLPLAETASTFGEMVLFEALLAKISDPQERKALIADKVADSYATICRQTYFVKFEIEAHKAIPEGASADDLEKLWMKTLKTQFGDAVEVDDMFKNEWSYIPHIVHTPFYCYAYSFGDLLSMSLFARYKREGQTFIPKIEAILRAGGSRDPQEVLQEVGIDMTSAEFWCGGFEIIKDWIGELKN